MDDSNITYQLSKRVSGFNIEDFNQEQVEDVKYKLLDWFGCAIGAISKPVWKKITRIFSNNTSEVNASVIGFNEKMHYTNAAFTNGMLGHILELDDVHKSSISHPGAIAIPSSLAIAEALNSNIDDLIMGIVVGYEVMIRLGDALNPTHYDYWHTTGTCGAFASAAASSRVRRFDAEKTNAALNMVSTMSSGLVSVFGTDTKLVTVGNACHAGNVASMFVDGGLTAPSNILEANNGYAAATSKENKLDNILIDLENKYMIDTAFYKIHASCGHTHSSIDGILSIMDEENIDAKEITKVEIGTYDKAIELTGDFNNQSEQKAKFSLPYCIACALIYGKVTLREFKDEILNSDEIETMSKKINVYSDIESNELYPVKRMAKVCINVGEECYEKVVPLPFGNPPKKFLEEKFLSLTTMSIVEKKAEKVMDYILNIDKMNKMEEFVEIFKYTI